MFKANLAPQGWHVPSPRRVLDFWLDIQQFEDANPGGHGALQLAILDGQLPDGLKKALDPQRKRD